VLIVTAGAGSLRSDAVVVDEVIVAGTAVVLGAMNLLMGLYIAEHHREDLLEDRSKLLLMQGITVGAFALAKLFIWVRWPIWLFPLGVFGLGLSIALKQRFAILWCIGIAVAIGFMKSLPGFNFNVAAT